MYIFFDNPEVTAVLYLFCVLSGSFTIITLALNKYWNKSSISFTLILGTLFSGLIGYFFVQWLVESSNFTEQISKDDLLHHLTKRVAFWPLVLVFLSRFLTIYINRKRERAPQQ